MGKPRWWRERIDSSTPHHSGAGFYDDDEIEHYNQALEAVRTGNFNIGLEKGKKEEIKRQSRLF